MCLCHTTINLSDSSLNGVNVGTEYATWNGLGTCYDSSLSLCDGSLRRVAPILGYATALLTAT